MSAEVGILEPGASEVSVTDNATEELRVTEDGQVRVFEDLVEEIVSK